MTYQSQESSTHAGQPVEREAETRAASGPS